MISVVKAIQTYFSAQPHGRKVEMSEFKALTDQDKDDFVQMLNDEGIECERQLGK